MLKQLVDDGQLIRISQGVYARAKPSSIDGKPIPVGGLATLREALGRLGIDTAPASQ